MERFMMKFMLLFDIPEHATMLIVVIIVMLIIFGISRAWAKPC
ncbi:hypothetical protein [Sporosarcina ureilytica]|nr:hypothetical protein [Sporosarcina ureilytica]